MDRKDRKRIKDKSIITNTGALQRDKLTLWKAGRN